MKKPKNNWQQFKVSPDQTHHLIGKQPAYKSRFLHVMKFHQPGLAPVKSQEGSFHIDALGNPIYSHRYNKTFGFYNERAAVCSNNGYFHILPNGKKLYKERYTWCGNFQEHLCVVRDQKGSYFHINDKGERAYPQSFRYAGDFRDGYAVVQNDEGLHTHILSDGSYLHKKWFVDLDVFHKGFARAKDRKGWFHISLDGKQAYVYRFADVEPFYNGFARAETISDGRLVLIDEKGEEKHLLRDAPLNDPFHALSGTLVSYWSLETIRAAVKLKIFDLLPTTLTSLSSSLMLPLESTKRLTRALQELGLIKKEGKGAFLVTEKGRLLQFKHPYSLAQATELWAGEHQESWRNLIYSLQTQSSAFKNKYGRAWFDWLAEHPDKHTQYHEVLKVYSSKDYEKLTSIIDFDQHRILLDLGGSTGSLLLNILETHKKLKGILFDLPEVLAQVKIPSSIEGRLEFFSCNFFENWPSFSVDGALLARILHDWSDEEAVKILKKVGAVLSAKKFSAVYIVENILDETTGRGSLLDLNMLVMTAGKERNIDQFRHILREAGFVLTDIRPMNEVTSVLVARKASN